MNHQINRLIYFGLQHHLISEDDEIYAVNLLLDLFHLDHFTKEEMSEELEVATDILEEMLDYACQKVSLKIILQNEIFLIRAL